MGGGRVTAAGLRCAGGDVVLGLNDAEVMVLRTVRHQDGIERDIVHLSIEGIPYSFQVTSNHRLIVGSADGSPVIVTAGSLLSTPRPVFDGRGFRRVEEVRLQRSVTEVVEITFDQDAVVLAWLLPKRASSAGRASLRSDAAVACLGARLRVKDFPINLDDFDLEQYRPCLHRHQLHRSRSADAQLQTNG